MRWHWSLLLSLAFGLAGCAGSLPTALPPAPPPAATAAATAVAPPAAIDAANAARLEFFQRGGVWSVVDPAHPGGETVLVLVGHAALANYPTIAVGSASIVNPQGEFPIAQSQEVLRLLDADTATWNQFLTIVADQVASAQMDAYLLEVAVLPPDRQVATADAQPLDPAGVLALRLPAAEAATATPEPPTPEPPTPTPAPAATAEVTPAAAARPTGAPIIPDVAIPAIPAMPAIPAIPDIELPTLPEIPAVPALPSLPAAPAGEPAPPVAVGAAFTLTAPLTNVAPGDDASAASATLDLVVAEDGQNLAGWTLHFVEVACGGATIGTLDQHYNRAAPVDGGQFTLPLAGEGAIQGSFTAPDAAQGTARLVVDLPFVGQCDLGAWEWETAP